MLTYCHENRQRFFYFGQRSPHRRFELRACRTTDSPFAGITDFRAVYTDFFIM